MSRFVLTLLAVLVFAAGAAADVPPTFIRSVTGAGLFDRVSQMAQASDGRVFIADSYRNRIVIVSAAGDYIGEFGSDVLNTPTGVVFDRAGNLYVAEQFNHRISKYLPSLTRLGGFGSFGTGPGQLHNPTNLAISPDGTRIYVTEFGNNRVSMFSLRGAFLGSFGSTGTGPGQFDHPFGIAVEPTGMVFVADEFNHRIQVFNAAGVYVSQFGTFGSEAGQFHFPVGLNFDDAGDLYVCDQLNNRVQKLTRNGDPLTMWGSFGNGPNEFYNCWAVLPTRNDGHIWVADTYNYRVQIFGFQPVPTVSRSWGSLKATYR